MDSSNKILIFIDELQKILLYKPNLDINIDKFKISLTNGIVSYIEKHPDEFKVKYLNLFNYTYLQKLRLEISHDLMDDGINFRMANYNYDNKSRFYEKYLSEILYDTAKDLGIITVAEEKLKLASNTKLRCDYIHPTETKVTLVSDQEVTLLEYYILTYGIESLWKKLNHKLYNNSRYESHDSINFRLMIIRYYHQTLELRIKLQDELEDNEEKHLTLTAVDLLEQFNKLYGEHDVRYETLKMYNIIKRHRSISKKDLFQEYSKYHKFCPGPEKVLKYLLKQHNNIQYKDDNLIYLFN
jgi:hypothetical protein